MKWSSLFVVVILTGSAAGQPCPGPYCPMVPVRPRVQSQRPNVTHPAVCRVANDVNYEVGYGSGTLVEVHKGTGLVISAAHIFTRVGTVWVKFPNVPRIRGKVIELEKENDLAAILIVAPSGISPIALAETHSKYGDRTLSCGYGTSNTYWCNSGNAVGYARRGNLRGNSILMVTGSARQGDSGGPILNSKGEIVGMVQNTAGGRTYGIWVGKIRAMLNRIRARWMRAFGRPTPQPAQPYVQPSPVPTLPNQPEVLPEVTPEVPGTYPDPPATAKDFTKELEKIKKGFDDRIGDFSEKVDGRFGELRESMDEAVEVRVGALSEEMIGRMDGVVEGVDNMSGSVGEISGNVDSLKGDLFWGGLTVLATAIGASWAPGLIRGGYRILKGQRQRTKLEEYRQYAETQRPPPLNQGGGVAAPPADSFPGAVPRAEEEGVELLRLGQLEGRDPLHDATIGRAALDRLEEMMQSSDESEKLWAGSFRGELLNQFNRIHPPSVLTP